MLSFAKNVLTSIISLQKIFKKIIYCFFTDFFNNFDYLLPRLFWKLSLNFKCIVPKNNNNNNNNKKSFSTVNNKRKPVLMFLVISKNWIWSSKRTKLAWRELLQIRTWKSFENFLANNEWEPTPVMQIFISQQNNTNLNVKFRKNI